MLKCGLMACFSATFGEHKVDSTVGKDWELENGKKKVILAFQKVAKTGNIGKKVQWQAISIK